MQELEIKRSELRTKRAQTKQDEIQKNILNFLRRKGYDDALTYGGGSTSS